MRSALLLAAAAAAAPLVSGIRIVQSNDDGWAEINARTLFNSLAAAGNQVVLSAPAENQSGTGSSDATPKTVDADGCQYSSCAPNSPAFGANTTDPRLNYVNSYPVTSIKRGISVTGPSQWSGAAPQLAVTGPNVGSNVDVQAFFSGTIGAAVYAAKEAKIPAIAFSGKSGDPTAWNTNPVPIHARVYADLALNLTSTLVAGGAPYLPEDVFLNVNFGAVTDDKCARASDFKFIPTRVTTGLLSGRDAEVCGSTRLPWEADVSQLRSGCFVSVSVGDAADKTTADAARQKVVFDRLKPILSCL